MPDGALQRELLDVEVVERRRFRRVPALRPVRYMSDRFGETVSRMLDLSCGGAYIESPVVPVGSYIELEFPLVTGHVVCARAIVRYVILGAGMGVEFEEISEEDRAEIEAFVNSFRS